MGTLEMTMAAAGLLGVAAAGAGAMWFLAARKLKSCEARAEKLAKEVESARTLDETTGAFNYPFFVKAANVQIKLARRHRWPVTLMVIDIDQLEKVNLRHSFRTGDAVLKHLADSIRAVVRSSDVLGRFGGSGVFVLLPECDIDNIPVVFERIEERIEKDPLEQNGKKIPYRRTAGAVTMYGIHIQLNAMLGLAEEALDAAKKRREKLVIFDKEGTEVQWK
ncbi:GGDEF domain-containing protein [Hydrogenimonas sp.]